MRSPPSPEPDEVGSDSDLPSRAALASAPSDAAARAPAHRDIRPDNRADQRPPSAPPHGHIEPEDIPVLEDDDGPIDADHGTTDGHTADPRVDAFGFDADPDDAPRWQEDGHDGPSEPRKRRGRQKGWRKPPKPLRPGLAAWRAGRLHLVQASVTVPDERVERFARLMEALAEVEDDGVPLPEDPPPAEPEPEPLTERPCIFCERTFMPYHGKNTRCPTCAASGMRPSGTRAQKRLGARAVTVGRKRLTKAEIETGKSLLMARGTMRPSVRGDCLPGGENAMRPCPYAACRFHLAIEFNPVIGSFKINFPDVPIESMRETCALDVADRGGVTLEEVGALTNRVRERVRQIEAIGLRELQSRMGGVGGPAD